MTMASRMSFKAFEKSSKDKEPKKMKEGSRKEETLDKKQMPKFLSKKK
jgi:hypothetical protein